MEFCDSCGSLMTPQDGVQVCPNDYEKVRDNEKEELMVTIESQESSEIIDMSDVDNTDIDSTTKVTRPKCDHDVAYYETKQIRSADKSETCFFACVGYDHKWCENDH